jgi:2-polyprenyl-3-methyl-5-hydroxy-6-metoxy-1,4-benzoquinol methylase
MYQSPLPTANDFRLMYEESTQFSSAEYRDAAKIQHILDYYVGCYREMLGLMQRPADIRLLEVGAGLAWLCRAAKTISPQATTVAQDVTPECASECTWVDRYVVGTIEDSEIDALAPYAVISLTHVIEHLPDPVSAIRRLRQVMSPDGCLFITCPHRPPSWSVDPDPGRWPSWSYNHVPGHLQYFSRDSMAKLGSLSELRLEKWNLQEDGQAVEAILRPS